MKDGKKYLAFLSDENQWEADLIIIYFSLFYFSLRELTINLMYEYLQDNQWP